ncbi:hypothetical protein E2C01_078969 [Portunus trituberculatus]|uniref:Uncharacterized protein n=1 Tax=Portunus trituberculatus TaxID=210409 RepID=A0A5B7IIF9_PORTR|nr:hypothetical protein [Portunus trituberculatus]
MEVEGSVDTGGLKGMGGGCRRGAFWHKQIFSFLLSFNFQFPPSLTTTGLRPSPFPSSFERWAKLLTRQDSCFTAPPCLV